MAMNEFLAELYSTNPETDVEKTAEAVLLDELVKIAADEGIDLDELSDDDIADILNSVFVDGGEEAGVDEGEKVAADEALAAEDQEKLADADFLGRTMAHAFYEELSEIGAAGEQEKEASRAAAIPPGVAKATFIRKLQKLLGRGRSSVSSNAAAATLAGTAGGAGLLVGGGGGYLAGKRKGKDKDKQASDEAIQERAQAILDAAAAVLEDSEKTSADEDELNAQALALLDADNYDVEKIVELLSE